MVFTKLSCFRASRRVYTNMLQSSVNIVHSRINAGYRRAFPVSSVMKMKMVDTSSLGYNPSVWLAGTSWPLTSVKRKDRVWMFGAL